MRLFAQVYYPRFKILCRRRRVREKQQAWRRDFGLRIPLKHYADRLLATLPTVSGARVNGNRTELRSGIMIKVS